MGRPAEQIEALQQRVRELEGRLRAYGGRVDAWESLPAENRLALLDVLAEEAYAMRDRGDAAGVRLAPVWEGAWAALQRFDTVTSKDKTQEQQAAELADVPPVLVAGDVLDEGSGS